MAHLAPEGPVYQAGTLSGNPVAMAAGMAALTELEQDGFYEELTKKTTYLLEGIQKVADKHSIAFTTSQVGGMFGLFFTDQAKVTSFAEVQKCDGEKFKKFFHLCLDHGVYLAPSSFEAGFVSAAHSYEQLDATITNIDKAFALL